MPASRTRMTFTRDNIVKRAMERIEQSDICKFVRIELLSQKKVGNMCISDKGDCWFEYDEMSSKHLKLISGDDEIDLIELVSV